MGRAMILRLLTRARERDAQGELSRRGSVTGPGCVLEKGEEIGAPPAWRFHSSARLGPVMLRHDRGTKIIAGERPSFGAAAGLQIRDRAIEIDQHHDAGFGGNAGERNEADRDGD